MIEQNVQVVRSQGERIWVRLGTAAGCTACDAGKGCGAGVFARLFQRKPVTLELPRRDVELKVGQMITLGFPEHVYLRLVFGLYGWPLLAALAGALIGHAAAHRLQMDAWMLDMATLAGALLAGAVALRLIRGGRSGEKSLMNTMQTTVYRPSSTPDMCRTEARRS